MGATGDHYSFGVPFSSLYLKHGNMGIGGTLGEGFLFIPDGSPPPASGDRTGWFIHPELLGIGLNVTISLLGVYSLSLISQRIRHAKQNG